MKKLCSGLFIVIISCSLLFATQSTLGSAVTERVDDAFLSQSKEKLENVLDEYKNARDYVLVESYVMKKIRQAIIFNRLDYAKEITLLLIDKNIDNFDAVDLYALVNKALVHRQEQDEARAIAQKEELARQEAQAEAVMPQIEKEYESMVNKESGETVYVEPVEEIRYSPVIWNANLILASVSFITTPTNLSLKYGFGATGGVYYYGDTLSIGIDLGIDSCMLSFFGTDSFVTAFHLVPSIAFSSLWENLFFRIGLSLHASDPSLDGTVFSPFVSPVFGIGIQNAKMGICRYDITTDFLAGGLLTDAVSAAIEARMKLFYPLADVGELKFGINIGLEDTLFILPKDNGLENRAKFLVSIGVCNYE